MVEGYSSARRSTQTRHRGCSYDRSWDGDSSWPQALVAGRDDDVRRGVTQRGPHRDELALSPRGVWRPVVEASQGEQRTLRAGPAGWLGASPHQRSDLGEPPLLLLDDVLSELDPDRCPGSARSPAAGADRHHQCWCAAARQPAPITSCASTTHGIVTMSDGTGARARERMRPVTHEACGVAPRPRAVPASSRGPAALTCCQEPRRADGPDIVGPGLASSNPAGRSLLDGHAAGAAATTQHGRRRFGWMEGTDHRSRFTELFGTADPGSSRRSGVSVRISTMKRAHPGRARQARLGADEPPGPGRINSRW